MIKLIVEITELNDERRATNIAFRTEEDNATDSENFWKGRLYPVLKDALNVRGLLGERALLDEQGRHPSK